MRARFGSAATGDPVYDAGVQLGKLLRTSFLADYFTNPVFRHALRRVLNRGEAVNAMKRSIYTGRIAPAQAKRPEEMQAVADALNLLANIVMAWNTMQLQAVLGRWANRRQFIAPELTGKIARRVWRESICATSSDSQPSATRSKFCRRVRLRKLYLRREIDDCLMPLRPH